MKQYLDLMHQIKETGVVKTDRTGTGTVSVFGPQMRFDLRQGFPLVTTKKTHLKSIIHELLWFLQGDTNTQYLKDNGVKIWDEWIRPYSLDREIQFIDPLQRRYVPYTGDFSYAGLNTAPDSIERKLVETWRHMMRRCYDPEAHNYATYGGQGACVSYGWHDAAAFIRDVQYIPHWEYKKHDWKRFELDKDYYGSNRYGVDTCVWLDTGENNIYTKAAKPLQITDSDGLTHFYITLNEASRQTGIASSTLSRFLKGMPSILKRGNKKYIGWCFEEADLQGKLPRLKLIKTGDLGPVYGHQWISWGAPDGTSINQIQQMVELLKNTPDSRRMVVSAWNVADLPQMALTPCHCLFQYYTAPLSLGERWEYVENHYPTHTLYDMEFETDSAQSEALDSYNIPQFRLDCQLYQRSADFFLGVPFNIASYALFTMMMAQVVNMVPGEFIWTGGDTHLYSNHVEQVEKQLAREPRTLPTMKINPEVKDIFAFKFEDFTLEGYDPYPGIKAPVAV